MGSRGVSHRWYAYARPSRDSSAAPGGPEELITQRKPFEGRVLFAEQRKLQPVHLVHPGTREELF